MAIRLEKKAKGGWLEAAAFPPLGRRSTDVLANDFAILLRERHDDVSRQRLQMNLARNHGPLVPSRRMHTRVPAEPLARSRT
jgi:hypothetical protein